MLRSLVGSEMCIRDRIEEATKLLDEIEKLGGMTKAVESGIPRQRIEAAAARRQALIDQGEEVIVGANKYQVENAETVEVREIDNSKVRKAQIRRLKKLKKNNFPLVKKV